MEAMYETLIPSVRTIDKHRGELIDASANAQFDDDWRTAISGDELVRRVHNHIDELYAQKTVFEKHLADAISGKELEKKVHKHIVEWYAARDKK
jgi:hypothetical protein